MPGYATVLVSVLLGSLVCSPQPPPTPSPSASPASASIAVPGSPNRLSIHMTFSGELSGEASNWQVQRLDAGGDPPICAEGLRRIGALFRMRIAGTAADMALIVDPLSAGPRQAVVTVNLLDASGQRPRGWSTFAGQVTVEPDRMSGRLHADLATPPSRNAAVTVDGTWRCGPNL